MENVEKQIVRIIENNSPELAAEEILRLLGVSCQRELFIAMIDKMKESDWQEADNGFETLN